MFHNSNVRVFGSCIIHILYTDFAVNKYLRTVASGWIFINIVMRVTSLVVSLECVSPRIRIM